LRNFVLVIVMIAQSQVGGSLEFRPWIPWDDYEVWVMIELTPRFSAALNLALELHHNQRRKGTEIPYMSHPLAVSALVLEYGGDEEEAVAALLHDAVEDGGGQPTLERIRENFGGRVAEIVDGCSDTSGQSCTCGPDWYHHKQSYLSRLQQAPEPVRLVLGADKLHNLTAILHDYRCVGDGLWERFKGGRDGVLWYYSSLSEMFMRHGPRAIGDELKRNLESLEREVGVLAL
jgi:(p)ppGpp synthase/HD superfamily hydrolase